MAINVQIRKFRRIPSGNATLHCENIKKQSTAESIPCYYTE